MKSKIEDKINNSHPLRGVPRALGGAAVGLTAGAVGLAAGITTGDMSKTAQYAGGAAVAGYAFGGSGAKGIANALTVDGTTEVMKEAYYGEEKYKQMQIDENVKKVRNDDSIRRELEKRLGDKQKAEEALQDATQYAVGYGLDSASEIAALYKLNKAGKSWEVAASQVQFASEFGKKTSKLSHKDSEDLNATIRDRVRKNSKQQLSKEEVEKRAIRIRKDLDMAGDIVHKKL